MTLFICEECGQRARLLRPMEVGSWKCPSCGTENVADQESIQEARP